MRQLQKINMENQKLLSIVLPTFNEKDNVLPLIEKLTAVFANTKYDYEMIFVDDSDDETPKIIEREVQKDPQIRLIYGNKEGLASAVIVGFEKSQGKYIGSMDTDLQHPPEVMLTMLGKAISDDADFVSASRYMKGGSATGLGSLKTPYGIYRRAVSLGMKWFTQIIFIPTRKTSDPLAGLFLFKRELLERVKLEPRGFKIQVELLVRTNPKKVSLVPQKFLPRENYQSKATLKQGLEFFSHLWHLFRTVPEAGRFIKFCIVGASGVIVNLGLLAILVEIFNIVERPAYIIAVAVSILTNYAFNSLFTYSDKKSPDRKESMRRVIYYYVFSVVTMFFNFAIFSFGLSIGLHYILAAIIGVIAATLLNFFLATKVIWRLPVKI